MQLHKILRDLHIFNSSAFWFCPSHFSPKVSQVRTKNLVSVVNVLHGNRGIGQQLFTYHPSELPLGGVHNHTLDALRFPGLLDFVARVSLKILSHSIHQH